MPPGCLLAPIKQTISLTPTPSSTLVIVLGLSILDVSLVTSRSRAVLTVLCDSVRFSFSRVVAVEQGRREGESHVNYAAVRATVNFFLGSETENMLSF